MTETLQEKLFHARLHAAWKAAAEETGHDTCPFCGGPGKILCQAWPDYSKYESRVTCRDCGCHTRFCSAPTAEMALSDAWAVWDRRRDAH